MSGASSTRTTGLRLAGVRMRLAVGLVLTTVMVAAVVAVSATAIAAWRADAGGNPTVGAARIGDGVVLIISDEDATAAAAARNETLRWSLVALGIAIVPASLVAWVVAGRLLGRVDAALSDVEAEDDERRRRLQEVVHELRTPLAVMGTNLELALSGADLDDESAGFADAARRALDRMDRTIDDLAGPGHLTVEAGSDTVDAAAVATDVIGEFSGPAVNRGLHLVAVGSGAMPVASADPVALRTVIANLVANAVRLAPKGSVVSLDWCADEPSTDGRADGWAWIAVSDEGPGLAERHHARVFERGWRGDHERHRDTHGGSGLGLTIARQLAEAQGGTLTVDSEEGGGSTFTVWLPVVADADPTTITAPDGIHPARRPWRRQSVVA